MQPQKRLRYECRPGATETSRPPCAVRFRVWTVGFCSGRFFTVCLSPPSSRVRVRQLNIRRMHMCERVCVCVRLVRGGKNAFSQNMHT